MEITKQNWMELSSVQLGGAICLPVVLIGYEIAKTSTLVEALCAIFLGNALLFLLAFLSARMAYENKKTTAENAALYLGKKGSVFFALIVSFSMIAWFAIQTQVMAEDLSLNLQQYAGIELSQYQVVSILAFCMVGLSFFGLQSVTLFATLTLPLMLCTLIFAVCSCFLSQEEQVEKALSLEHKPFFTHFSLVLASAILCVVDLPTFFRHAESKKDASFAAGVTFLLGIPFVECVGVVLGRYSPASSLVNSLVAIDHPLFHLWVAFFILLAGWTTNNTNLFSAYSNLQAVFKMSAIQAKSIVAVFAIWCVFMPMLENLGLVLDVIGVLIASLGGSVMMRFFIAGSTVSERVCQLATLSGALSGFSTLFTGGFLTQCAIVDALLVSAFFVGVVVIKKEVVYEKN